MGQSEPRLDELRAFFDSFRRISKAVPLEKRLERFFSQYQAGKPISPRRELASRTGGNLDLERFSRFCDQLEAPLAGAKQAGFFCNPWKVASLKRDEVRNTAVLAWWLNPKGEHGLGEALLTLLLKAIRRKDPDWPITTADRHCKVRVETSPDGDRSNRVDIEVNGRDFFLIIEVKIDAPQGDNQLQRYRGVAERRCHTKPWRILFLTRDGKPGFGCMSSDADTCIPFSWKEFGSLLKKASADHLARFNHTLFPELAVVKLLARTFIAHIKHL